MLTNISSARYNAAIANKKDSLLSLAIHRHLYSIAARLGQSPAIAESTKKRKRQSKDLSITDSIPFPSGFPESPTQKRTETKGTFESYRELILENIDYDVLASDPHVDQEQLDEIVDLVQETVCSTRSQIRVAGNDYPAEVVRSKLLKLNSEHIRFVTDCLKQNTTRIRNIRQYLLASLFNAPSTMSSYYTALVAHDMAAA